VGNTQTLARLLLRFFQAHGRERELLRWVISEEVARAVSPDTIFRFLNLAGSLVRRLQDEFELNLIRISLCMCRTQRGVSADEAVVSERIHRSRYVQCERAWGGFRRSCTDCARATRGCDRTGIEFLEKTVLVLIREVQETNLSIEVDRSFPLSLLIHATVTHGP
jgi:hypothetical protein